ncbi:MAG: 4a-hydroxytetrahydrobiopterin dehydratase [Hyphomicrobiales bacterium]
MSSEKLYSASDVVAKLSTELPNWKLHDGQIMRTFKTHGFRVSLMIANAIGHLSEVAWHHPELVVSFSEVTVKLYSHDVDGITDRDFEMAHKIENIIAWQPRDDAGALTGIPEKSAKFAYLKQEE